MAEVLLPFHYEQFNKLPSLHTSTTTFSQKNGMDFVDKTFRSLVEKHKLQDRLGVGLAHRHFSLNSDEMLVEFNNIATPWKDVKGDQYGPMGKVVPTAWLITGDKLMPYEFSFTPLGKEKAFDFTNLGSFLTEFVKIAKEIGLNEVIALRLFPGQDFKGYLEITNGRSNIVLNPDQVGIRSLGHFMC